MNEPNRTTRGKSLNFFPAPHLVFDDDRLKNSLTHAERDFLMVIDQFALALKFIPDTTLLPEDQRKVWENWLIGVRAVQSQWEQMAASIGLKRISTEGAFNPSIHEATAEECVEGGEPGSIIRVVQEGWQLHEKILRPAKVVVAK